MKFIIHVGKQNLFHLDKIEGFDIDWEDDFTIAESLISSKKENI